MHIKIAFFLILLTFFESLKVVLTNVITILMIPAKLVTLTFLKIKKVVSSQFLSMMPLTKFYHENQVMF